MSIPFKMKPGRGNMPKTGRGIPPTLMCGSPTKQTDPKSGKTPKTKAEAREEIDNIFSENTRRVAAEAIAKSDSTTAAKGAMLIGKSKKESARIGNAAANITRAKQNIPNVGRYQQVSNGNPGGVSFPKPDYYHREGKLEKDPKRSTVMTYRNSK